MTKINREDLPDIQNSTDTRGKCIERVGVERVKLPISISRKKPDGVSTTVMAYVSMYVSIDSEIRGSNMSRFMECLMSYESMVITSDHLKVMVEDMLARLGSKDGYIEIRFNYFLPRNAPVSGVRGVQGYEVAFIGREVKGKYDFVTEVNVTGTNLCPCSKEISAYGAHNQRCNIRARIVPNRELYWIEDIIETIEQGVSCPIFPVLKREDEKWVTEHAYDNPKFVEDLARDIAIALDNKGIEYYNLKCTADESIHHHEAVAYLRKDWILE
jgi:GTP cyclohydrolase I